MGCILGRDPCGDPANREARVRYPVGRYQMVDREVKNGFVYFYSVTAFDSTGLNQTKLELSGRRAAVEADAVVPQASVGTGRNVWVVPNPYRVDNDYTYENGGWEGRLRSWTENNRLVKFIHLPEGEWTIRVFSLAGDQITTIENKEGMSGYSPLRGEIEWDLLSQSNRALASGVYVFTVESKVGTQIGKFVLIR